MVVNKTNKLPAFIRPTAERKIQIGNRKLILRNYNTRAIGNVDSEGDA